MNHREWQYKHVAPRLVVEELLLDDDQLRVSHAMRRQLSGLGVAEGMIELLGAMKKTSTNRDLIDWVRNRS